MKVLVLLITLSVLLSSRLYSQTEKKSVPQIELKKPAKRFLFTISDSLGMVAFKKDTVAPWVVMDTASTLSVLLNLIEMNYKREQADSTKRK